MTAIARGFGILCLAFILSQVTAGKAIVGGTVTINDLTDTITLSDTTGRASCEKGLPAEECQLGVMRPSGTITSGYFFDFDHFKVIEPDGQISDIVAPEACTDNGPCSILFESDVDGVPLSTGGPSIPEKPGIQIAGTIT